MWNRAEGMESNSNSNAAGFLLGALTGKKMREDLAKQYEGISTKVSSLASDAMNRASEVVSSASERATDLVGRATDRATDYTDRAAETAHDAVDAGRNKVNHVMSQANQQAKARS